jgi:hypothetical protein
MWSGEMAEITIHGVSEHVGLGRAWTSGGRSRVGTSGTCSLVTILPNKITLQIERGTPVSKQKMQALAN